MGNTGSSKLDSNASGNDLDEFFGVNDFLRAEVTSQRSQLSFEAHPKEDPKDAIVFQSATDTKITSDDTTQTSPRFPSREQFHSTKTISFATSHNGKEDATSAYFNDLERKQMIKGSRNVSTSEWSPRFCKVCHSSPVNFKWFYLQTQRQYGVQSICNLAQ